MDWGVWMAALLVWETCARQPGSRIAYLDQFIYCIAKALSANFMLYKAGLSIPTAKMRPSSAALEPALPRVKMEALREPSERK